MPKLVVGPHTYVWGNDALGLPHDPDGWGPRVLNLADAKSLTGEFDIAGWEALREPRVFPVYLLDGTKSSVRQVLVGETQFPLTIWQRPVESDVPSPELVAALETIKLQDKVIEQLRAGGDHHPITEDIVAVPIEEPTEPTYAASGTPGIEFWDARLRHELGDLTFPDDDAPKGPEAE